MKLDSIQPSSRQSKKPHAPQNKTSDVDKSSDSCPSQSAPNILPPVTAQSLLDKLKSVPVASTPPSRKSGEGETENRKKDVGTTQMFNNWDTFNNLYTKYN
jgi:hypothetical protein